MLIQRDLKIKKCLLIAFCIIAICLTTANAQDFVGMTIDKVQTAGNITIGQTQILSRVRARAGEQFLPASAEEDTKRIAKIEGVEYSYYNAELVKEKLVLTYVVVEQNLIRSISINGNKKIKDSRILKEIGFKKGDYLDIFLARRGIELIDEIYKKKGYVHVEIEIDEEKLKTGQVIYNIKEGPRVKINSVKFTGNDTLKAKQLKKALKNKTRKFVLWPVYFDTKKIDVDLTKLRDIYLKKGYLNVSIVPSTIFTDDKAKVDVTFAISEGSVYTIDQVAIQGDAESLEDQFSEELKLEPQGIFSQAKADYDQKKIIAKYREIGFIEATVEQVKAVDDYKNTVQVTYDIKPGDRFRIGKINVTGNREVHDKVVRRVLDEENFKPGKWYNGDIARGNGQGMLEKDLKRFVMAESAFIQPTGSKPDYRDVHVNVAEARTGSIMLGAGVASNSGLIGQLVFDQRNFDIFDWPEDVQEFVKGKAFKGAGQRLRISMEPGTQQSYFSFSFSEPFLYDKPVSMDVMASSFERGRDNYDEQRTKLYVGFEKRYEDKWRRGISFRAEQVKISDIDFDAPQEIYDDKGRNNIFGVKLYVRKDTTNSRFTPSKGYHFDAGYEQVFGDFTFGKINATQRWYTTLYEDLAERKTILETKLHAETVIGDAPIFEKSYAGGTGSIRGFEYRGVSTRGASTGPGPTKYEDAIGSEWLITGNVEVAIPLTAEVISWLFFTDAGLIDQGGVRASVGTGIQILLPQWFGPVPMRFELATPIAKEDEDETQAFSFTVGALF